MRRAAPLALAAALAACTTPPPAPERAPLQPALPAAFGAASSDAPSLAERPWGELLRDREFEALVGEALRNNRDLRVAAERVELARAQYGLARSALVPTIAADASLTEQRVPTPLDPDSNRRARSAQAVLAMPAWEIDLWGRLRSLSDAALASVQASEAQRTAVQVSLIAQVAQGWVDLLSIDQQLDIARETARTRREGLRLVQLRFDAGVVSMVDVTQAQSSLAVAEQTTAELERRRALSEHALSLLLGRVPGPVARRSKLADYALPAQLPAGLPSDLLRRRPDVLAAERSMAAADADVDAARKAFLPSVSLTGFVGLVSPQLSQLLDPGRLGYGVTPAVTLPLFTGGRLEANLDAASARRRISVEEYGRTVHGALREVEDALVSYQRLVEQRAALDRLVAASRERLRLTELRYLGGISSYFEVLDAQRALFDAELSRTQTTGGAYASVVQLYRALGGGWTNPNEESAK